MSGAAYQDFDADFPGDPPYRNPFAAFRSESDSTSSNDDSYQDPFAAFRAANDPDDIGSGQPDPEATQGPAAADNRSLINAAERAADPDRYATPTRGLINAAISAAQAYPSSPFHGDAGDEAAIALGGGRYLLPDGRIQTITVTASDPVELPWYDGGQGPVYRGDGGVPFQGLARHTRHEVPDAPVWARENGAPLAYTFDGTGQPYWRTESGQVMSIPAPYAQPTLSGLQGGALLKGVKEGVLGLPSLPGQLADGVGNVLTGNFTVDSLMNGVIEGSPVGMLLAAQDDDYRTAGQGLVGVGAGLAGGMALERVVVPRLALGARDLKTYAADTWDAASTDVSGNPFLADQARSVGSKARGGYSPRVIEEAHFDDLRFDMDKKRFTSGAIEEIRAMQAAQREGLAPGGTIVRGKRGADMTVELGNGDTVEYSIKAYRDGSVLEQPRKFDKLSGSLKADSTLFLLLDQAYCCKGSAGHCAKTGGRGRQSRADHHSLASIHGSCPRQVTRWDHRFQIRNWHGVL